MATKKELLDKTLSITKDCPCELPKQCYSFDYCKETGNQCRVYKDWVHGNMGGYARQNKATHIASDIKTASDRKIERAVKALRR